MLSPSQSFRYLIERKQANVLADKHFTPKLADFGLTTLHGAGMTTMGSQSANAGTIRFMAPELFEETGQLSFSSDIYAFGCLCVEVRSCDFIVLDY